MRNCVIAIIRRLTRFSMRRYNPGMEYPEEIVRYYASRNDVYDEAAVYLGKEAEELRAPIKDIYRRLFSGKNVLEIACGSGYWTRVLAGVAASVLAVDINVEKAFKLLEDIENTRNYLRYSIYTELALDNMLLKLQDLLKKQR